MIGCRQKRFFTVFSILGMVICPLFALGQKQERREPPRQNIRQQTDNFIYVLSPMKLGCEALGIHLDLVTKGVAGDPMEAWEHIRLTDGSQSLLLQQLNDLRHHVRFTEGPTALRYVRLLTSPETWFLWNNGKIAVEIMEAGSASTLPNFGLDRQPLILTSPDKMEGIKGGFQSTGWMYDPRDHKMQLIRHSFQNGKDKEKVLRTMNPPDFTILGIGSRGILTHKAYQVGNFSAPSILPVNGGFQITRWLYVEDYSGTKGKESIQQVQEFVGTDGEYRQTVLKTLSPPPSLPDTHFSIPKFE
jgi:hypothetical protein